MLALDLLTRGTGTSWSEGSVPWGLASPATGGTVVSWGLFSGVRSPPSGRAVAAPSVAAPAVGVLGAAWTEREGHPRPWAVGRAPSRVPGA